MHHNEVSLIEFLEDYKRLTRDDVCNENIDHDQLAVWLKVDGMWRRDMQPVDSQESSWCRLYLQLQGEDYAEAKEKLFSDPRSLTGVYAKIVEPAAFALVYDKFESSIIPREVLFGNPDIASVTISPDGQKLAYLAAVKGVMNVFVADIMQPHKGVPITHDTQRGVQQYHWAFDNRHILYLQDSNGDENWHVFAVNVDTLQARDLTPFKGAMSTIAKVSEHIPESIVIATNN
jgi:hypothetical protein